MRGGRRASGLNLTETSKASSAFTLLPHPPQASTLVTSQSSANRKVEQTRAMTGGKCQAAFDWPDCFRMPITGRTVRWVAQTMDLGATDTWIDPVIPYTGYVNLAEP